MCRTLLLLSLSAAFLSGCKEFPDDLPPPAIQPQARYSSWIRSLRPMLKLAGGQISAQIPKTTSTSFIAMSTTVTSSMRTAIQRGLEQRARRCCWERSANTQVWRLHQPARSTSPITTRLKNISATQNEVSTANGQSPISSGVSKWEWQAKRFWTEREHPTSFTIARPDFSFTRLPMQRTLPNGINTSCTKHSADSLHASHPSSMVRPFGFPTSIGISAKLHSTSGSYL